MLLIVCRELDQFLHELAEEAQTEGFLRPSIVELRLIGQMALIETPNLPLKLRSTQDVDLLGTIDHVARVHLKRLLKARKLQLDPVAHEAWMPKETQYQPIYEGEFVHLSIADPAAVLVSKAKMSPEKNRPLIQEYLSKSPPDRFFKLAQKYQIDLESFL